ncbi:CubicO group peptidase (beta-lactamase class C family) [Ureibacillus xyleni]|uniref:CubicO group peptidase (Beta-lactamase class C family) n=1 Tax=Ureibacillus xyleni TaxID=614648 RepID=A0A285TTX2_9BACL|nr:serine hydrolase domain-containing protein [Ureibacillus xyleni]SOC25040.1 CubicO group peptidase (beta-lactamase class C family) [Ureibacillus xyleni]
MKKFLKVLLISLISIVLIAIILLLLLGRDSHKDLKGTMPEQLDQYLKNQGFQGVVLILKDNKEIFKKGYGMAGSNIQNTPSTPYQIASLSKTFTAIAILQLVEKKLLSIDEPIDTFFPEYPNAEQITVGHLLSHSSGIPDYLNPEFNFDYSKEWKPEDIINVTKDAKLQFTPGESFQYSNTGYVMLGMIIENVSGLPYAEYIEEHIFKPSGMENSTFSLEDGNLAAIGHVEGVEGPTMNNTAAFAAGDIISTVEDLARFDQAIRNHVIISAESDDLMGTTQVKKFPYQYGYGWYTQNVMGHDAVGHSGGYPSGFRHYIARLLDEGITVIVLSNEMTTNSKKINRNLTSIMLQEPIWIWEELL